MQENILFSMVESRHSDFPPRHDSMAEIYALRQRILTEGAFDEEVPFIDGLLRDIDQGLVRPEDALRALQKKMASRNSYH